MDRAKKEEKNEKKIIEEESGSVKHRRITIEICMRFTENHIHNQF